uniref:hypothetical protein n=1 Tax=Paraburkholderia sp. TaxID=1926495 RepID=UPI0039E413ED
MRSDRTAAEFAQPQPLPGALLDDAGENVRRRPARALTRVAFCFAWLFGLEPFLTVSSDEATRLDRH